MYWSKRVNPGAVFELAFLMGNIEEPAFMLLDVQLYTCLSWTILKEHYPHVLYVITRCALVELERSCIRLLLLESLFYFVFLSVAALVQFQGFTIYSYRNNTCKTWGVFWSVFNVVKCIILNVNTSHVFFIQLLEMYRPYDAYKL